MGEACQPGGPASSGHRRRKLWEIDKRLHCSVIGTCLTMGDLRRIEARLKIEPLKDGTDFQVHGNFVIWASRPGPAARLMHKLLERRYAAAIRRFATAADAAALAALWADCLDDGDIPGPYWALLTHPRAGVDLVMRAFGQVHMLSHLVGAANRADIRRLVALEAETERVSEALASARRRLAEQERDERRMLLAHAEEMRVLAEKIAAADAISGRLEAAEVRIAAFERGDVVRQLRAACDAAETDLAAARREARALEEELSRITSAHEHECQRNTHLSETNRALAAECDAMEALLRQCCALSDGPDHEPDQTKGLAIDLGGRRIGYVGGRSSVVPHLRALVERAGGLFIHHDGGLEERTARLESAIGQCDAVFCPVDCVSHDACLRAKRTCRQRATAFVPLRGGSLSSFVEALRRLDGAAFTPDGDEKASASTSNG
jgi:hypothetical protein